jgi:hypothetical protein
MGLPDVGALSDVGLRDLLTAAVAEYSKRVQVAVDGGGRAVAPLDPDRVTPTDVVIVAGRMLEALDIAPFELAALKY